MPTTGIGALLARHEPRGDRGQRRAAGIYGTIITAAIIDTAGGHVSTSNLVVSVFVTLLVYWAAEGYAELLGEHTQEGRLPGWKQARASMAARWLMVAASYHGWSAGRAARLEGKALLAATLMAGALGVVMILLKELVLLHLH